MDALSYFGLILILGIFAQWAAWRFQLPSILLLLALGFGLSITTGVKIDDYIQEDTLLSIVGIFVAIILFEGGMTLKFSDLKEAGTPVVRLCTLTVLIGFVLTFLLMYYGLDYSWPISALLGAILMVTGPTVVSPLLRLIKPSKKMSSIVKWEGIVVDPIGAILALLVFEFALLGWSDHAKSEYFYIALGMLGVGVLLPIVLAKGIIFLLKRHLIPDFLHSVFLLAVVAGSFALANHIQEESGLLTVTVLGMALVNQKDVNVRHILEFKENLQILIISLLFIMLSGRIELEAMKKVLIPGLILIAGLILVIRPIAVYFAMFRSEKTSLAERTFLAFLAPRGIVAAAVCSVFALEIEHAAEAGKFSQEFAEQAHDLVPLVFMCIIGTVLVYGFLALPLAKKLGVTTGRTDGVLFAGAEDWIVEIASVLAKDGHNVFLMDTKYEKIADAKLAGLPAERANVLSEYAEHELDMGGIGQLVATTPNDEINSLACLEYTHKFGRKNVWQVAPQDAKGHHTKAVSHAKRARICFTGTPTFRELETEFHKPHSIKSTTLSDVFTVDDFYEKHGEGTFILFISDDRSGLRPAHDESRIGEGTTIYAYVPEKKKVKADLEDTPMMGL